VVLRPIAGPALLGLFGLLAATLVVGSNLAGWWGDHATSPILLFPFVMIFGGIAQFLAGMWSYTARDGLATVLRTGRGGRSGSPGASTSCWLPRATCRW
jgi:succinate-acetate transporter protein